jgi:pilus assembly protein Flp/PilA
MRKLFSRLFRNDSGSNALEYGLILSLISITIVAGATAAGVALSGLFATIAGLIPAG